MRLFVTEISIGVVALVGCIGLFVGYAIGAGW